jgi:hypothetical protein
VERVAVHRDQLEEEARLTMTARSVILLDTHEPLDTRISRQIVAAQLRAETRSDGANPKALVRAVAAELRRLGLEPDMAELKRRYVGAQPVVTRSR